MRITAVVFGISAAVVAGSALLTYSAGERVIRLRQEQEKRRQAMTGLEEIFSAMQDAETGQRGFVLTGDESYLQPFKRAQALFPQFSERLRQLTAVGVPGEESAQLERAINDKVGELNRAIELRRQGGLDPAVESIRTGAGKEAMDRIREVVGRIRQQQESQLQESRRGSAIATRERTVIFIGSALVTLLVLLWGFLRIRHSIEERNAAVIQRQQERDLLSTTLASIGDCVIVTDVDGRITFMNAVASAVTGWTLAETKGRPLKEIFRIINEESRAPVEDPVEKVIRTGVIVGLANHTVLIRKDGSEIPIDDSGAPIRAPEGELEGVVLVFRDFSETKKTQRELLAAKETAEAANRAKDNFIAMVSHELRTPLTPVLATLNLWELKEDLPADQRNDVQMLRRNVELEARMIDDLLDLTRMSRGILSIRPEVVDVHAILQQLVSLHDSEIQGKRLNLNMQTGAKRHFVRADATRLHQVIWNILRNAINFTDYKGSLGIETGDEGEQIAITIRDSGVGMSPETLGRVFLPFEQADRARSDRYGGLGLGMSISYALAKQMGGTLTAESEGLGKGSQFTLRLPSLKEGAVAPTRPKPATEAVSKRKILIVEDHLDTALALTRLLKLKGHEVQTASTIQAARAAFDNGGIDLIICDIGLPDGTGYDLVKAIRAKSNIAAIALTGFGMSADIDRAMQAGFDSHLTKPVDVSRLETAIAQVRRQT
jgi:PAS domain S-box-containing protein